MKRLLVIVLGLALLTRGVGGAPPTDTSEAISSIAFGSCGKQDRPQPIWHAIVDSEPDLFIFLGDNIYADTEDMKVMRRKYGLLAAKPGFAELRATTPIVATWDDHDYGENDAGREYPQKVASQREFLRFFEEPADSPRWHQGGVYDQLTLGPDGQRMQVILLDTRFHRSPLKRGEVNGRKGYLPDDDPAKTMLGRWQWEWLGEQLRKPAEIRIIASSIQFVAEEHRFEKWSNLPGERRRLLELIRDAGAGGVIFISGDRHLAEISRLDESPAGYPIHDVTSSGLNQGTGRPDEPNRHRLGENYRQPNFGTIDIDWSASDPEIELTIRGIEGRVVRKHALRLSELRPPAPPQP